ncbi:MAG: thiaminase II [Vicinamibacterales bacterium]
MQAADFLTEARERESQTWNTIHQHPFVRGIGAGTLSRSRWAFYLREDHAYLVDSCKVLALALARSGGWEDIRFFSRLLNTTVEVEMPLHLGACAELGISRDELQQHRPSFATLAYASHLIRTACEGGAADINAALLPCYAGYVEVAERLQEAGLPGEPRCRAWIEAYVSPEMRGNAAWMARRMNEHAAGASPSDRSRWLDLYSVSARFELLFFDMCWQESPWPGREELRNQVEEREPSNGRGL